MTPDLSLAIFFTVTPLALAIIAMTLDTATTANLLLIITAVTGSVTGIVNLWRGAKSHQIEAAKFAIRGDVANAAAAAEEAAVNTNGNLSKMRDEINAYKAENSALKTAMLTLSTTLASTTAAAVSSANPAMATVVTPAPSQPAPRPGRSTDPKPDTDKEPPHA